LAFSVANFFILPGRDQICSIVHFMFMRLWTIELIIKLEKTRDTRRVTSHSGQSSCSLKMIKRIPKVMKEKSLKIWSKFSSQYLKGKYQM